MKLHVVGCSHHHSSVSSREQIAFSPAQVSDALIKWRQQYPAGEAVLISTCNRVELYAASQEPDNCPDGQDCQFCTQHCPTGPIQLTNFIADYHGIDPAELFGQVFDYSGEDAIRHLFTVAASLDSMVIGEGQILPQVKQAYDLATERQSAGPLTHAAFQAAIRVAKRVANETEINRRRVSIPSIAVSDFAGQIFESFADKHVLVIGAGEMGEETLRYLIDEGTRDVTVVNRNHQRAIDLAERFNGKTAKWEELDRLLVEADLIVTTTGATDPIVTLDRYQSIAAERYQRPLFILDLAIPRDFDPAIGECLGVYLYSIDDLKVACDKNKLAREKEWPKAQAIIEEETERFIAELHHRNTGPTIKRLKERAGELKDVELARLLNKLDSLDAKSQKEIQRAFDRLVNKILHPPLESLRDESDADKHHGMLSALRKLFQLRD